MGARVRGAMAVAFTVLACAATQADARSEVARLPRGFGPFGDPQAALAGNLLVYADPVVFSRTALRVAGPHGEDRPLVTLQPYGVNMAASPSLLALLHVRDLLTGPPLGPLTAISHCAGGAPAVDGGNVAYLEDGCAAQGTPGAVVVAESSPSPATHPIPLPANAKVDYLSLAGAYVAYRLTTSAGHEIVVNDWQTGTEAMRVPAGSDLECGAATHDGQLTDSFCGLAVQADGTVAELIGRFFYYPGGPSRYEEPTVNDTCGGTIYRLSPADPRRHPIWSKACTDEPLRIASGRVLFANRSIVGVGVVDLDGHERDLGSPNAVYGFDGTHVFVNEETCIAASVVSSSVLGDDPGLAFTRGQTDCPARLRDARLIIARHHSRLMATLYCRNGCLGPAVVGTDNYVDAASADFKLRPGGTKRLTFRLPTDSDIVRRARGKRRVRIAFTTFGPRFDPHESALNEAAHGGGTGDWHATAAVHAKNLAQTGPR